MSGDVLCVFSMNPDPFMFDTVDVFVIYVTDDLVAVMSYVVYVVGDYDVAVVTVFVPGTIGGRLEPGQRDVRQPC